MNTGANEYRVIRSTRASKISAVVCAFILVALICAPLWAGRADMRLLGELYLYLSLACLGIYWQVMRVWSLLVSKPTSASAVICCLHSLCLGIFIHLQPFL